MSGQLQNALPEKSRLLRVLLSLVIPPLAALITGYIINTITSSSSPGQQATTAVLMTGLAISSWLMGLSWYGREGMGLRSGRPLTSGIGFAALAWILFLVLRFIFVGIEIVYPENSTRNFIYLLLFEAFATQLWAFGLVFRTIADWRGPLTAAIASGILFGLIGTLFFQENFSGSRFSIIYFISWGLLYGFIRLRTGSFLGIVVVQAMQSFTAWIVISPGAEVDSSQLQNLYISAVIVYLIIIWRLWPRNQKDYRV